MWNHTLICPLCKAQLKLSLITLAPSRFASEVRCTSCGKSLTFPPHVRVVAVIAGLLPAVALYWALSSARGFPGRLFDVQDRGELFMAVIFALTVAGLWVCVSGLVVAWFGKLVVDRN